MLRDAYEINLMKGAWESGIREPGRRADHFTAVADDFLPRDMKGQRVADLGPGHFDFGKALRQRGANVVGLELDPAVITLGRHRGFQVLTFDLRKDAIASAGPFDGIFCNGSTNCNWYEDQAAHVADIVAALKPGGWAWIAPCNTSDPFAQIAAFRAAGFTVYRLSYLQRRRYGVSVDAPPAVLFTLNLLGRPSLF